MGRYIYLLLACGLFDISRISATNSGPAPDTAADTAAGTVAGTVGTVKSQQEQDAEDKAKEYEYSFVAFIKENKEEYKYLFLRNNKSNNNNKLMDIFKDDIDDDYQYIEINYDDIPKVISNWSNSLSQGKRLPNTFKELFFKEMNKRLNEKQNWRIHDWVFIRDKGDKNKFVVNEELINKLSETKPILGLHEFDKYIYNKVNKNINDIIDKYSGDFNDQYYRIANLALFLIENSRSLPIWRIRDIMCIPLKQSFLLELQRNESTKSLEQPPEDKSPEQPREDKPKSKSWINDQFRKSAYPFQRLYLGRKP